MFSSTDSRTVIETLQFDSGLVDVRYIELHKDSEAHIFLCFRSSSEWRANSSLWQGANTGNVSSWISSVANLPCTCSKSVDIKLFPSSIKVAPQFLLRIIPVFFTLTETSIWWPSLYTKAVLQRNNSLTSFLSQAETVFKAQFTVSIFYFSCRAGS